MNKHIIPQELLPSQLPALSAAATMAIEALKIVDPFGRHNLVAIHPETARVRGRTFEPYSWAEVAEWVDLHDGEWNCYFSANEPRADAPHDKLSKAEIGAVRCLYVDKDPEEGVPLAEARRDLSELAKQTLEGTLPPTLAIDSGGGVQFIWNLDKKLDGEQFRDWAEQQGRGLASVMASDRVQNIERVLRLPGTLNIPNAKKRARGREPRRATTLYSDPGRGFTPEQFAKVALPLPAPQHQETEHLVAAAQEDIEGAGVGPADFDQLPEELRDRFGEACQRFPPLNDLWAGKTTGLAGDDESGSGWRCSLARRLAHADGLDFSAADYAALAFAWPLPQVEASLEKQDPVRQLARDWGRLGAPVIEWRKALINQHFEEPSLVLGWIDPAAWSGKQPPAREWEVEGWIPRQEVTLLYGDGGVGKTLLIHQYATAAAAGLPWLGQNTRKARVMCFFCEDSEEELHRRQIDINRSLGVTMGDIAGLKLISRKHGEDNTFAHWDRNSGTMKLSPVWHQLRADAVTFGADVLVIDTIADVFGGNEIDRVQVNAFVKGCLGGLAKAISGSVVALAHPSAAGKSSGSGTSGSTAWNNAARSRLYLRHPKNAASGNIRELEGMKLNYGPKGSLLKLRWDQGAFVVIAGSTPAAANHRVSVPFVPSLDDAAETAVLSALLECHGVQMSTSRNSQHFTPKVLKRHVPEVLSALSDPEIDAAILRLAHRNIIRHQPVGKNSSRHSVSGYVVMTDKLSATMPAHSVFE